MVRVTLDFDLTQNSFGVSGINMFGIGLLMVGVDSKLKDLAGKIKE